MRCCVVLLLALAGAALSWETVCTTYQSTRSGVSRPQENDTCAPPPRAEHSVIVRNSTSGAVIVVFGGETGGHLSFPRNDLWAYSTATRTWKGLSHDWRELTSSWSLNNCSVAEGTVPPRQGHVAVYDSQSDAMYVVGGSCGSNVLRDLWAYSFGNGTWTQVSTAAPPLSGHAAVWYSGSIYVLGGYNSDLGALSSSVWQWFSQNNTWAKRTDIAGGPSARQYHSASILGNQILVFGGYDSSSALGDLWQLDLSTASWSMKNGTSTTPSIRMKHAAAGCSSSSSNYLVVFGGANGQDTTPLTDTWKYDLSAGSWSILSQSTSTERASSAMGCTGLSAWAFGGLSSTTFSTLGNTYSDLLQMSL